MPVAAIVSVVDVVHVANHWQFYYVEDVTNVPEYTSLRLKGCVAAVPGEVLPRAVIHDIPLGLGTLVFSRNGYSVDTQLDAELLSSMSSWTRRQSAACMNNRVWSLVMFMGPLEKVCHYYYTYISSYCHWQ